MSQTVVLPTADLVQAYLEKVISASEIQIDWLELGKFWLDTAQNAGSMMDFLHESFDEMAAHMDSSNALEFVATRELLLALQQRLGQIGYDGRSSLKLVFVAWVGYDMVASHHLSAPPLKLWEDFDGDQQLVRLG